MKHYNTRVLAAFVVAGILLLFHYSASGQPVTVKGIVKTASGEAFFNVSVKAVAEKKEVFTGPDGLFMLDVSPLSVIKIDFPGYVVSVIKVKYTDIDTTITLTAEKPETPNTDHVLDERKTQDVQSTFQGSKGNSNIYGAGLNPSSSLLPVFSQKENTEGSRYLNSQWQKGYVINVQQTLINNPSFFYNYDKIAGDLLLSQDKRTAVAIGKEQISRFCLVDDSGDSTVFEMIPAISDRLYAARLVAGTSYNLFRVTETKLNKADYHTDGMTETGSRYDEYIDSRNYYIQNTGEAGYRKLKMTRKGLKAVFASSATAREYLSDHNLEPIDEVFLKALVNTLNRN